MRKKFLKVLMLCAVLLSIFSLIVFADEEKIITEKNEEVLQEDNNIWLESEMIDRNIDTKVGGGDWDYEIQYADFWYGIEDNQAIMIGYAGNNRSSVERVEVPSAIIQNNNRYDVTEMDGYLFKDFTNLKVVVIPKSVTYIGSLVFYGCSSDVIIYCYEGSYAEQYAKNKKIYYEILSEDGQIPEKSISRFPAYMFNSRYYADANPDLKKVFGYNEVALKDHYISFGVKEGRRASPVFDAKYYLNKYSDLKNAFGANNYEAAYNHFVSSNTGIHEGRRGSNEFDVGFYMNEYPDLKRAFDNNYEALAEHFVNFGRFEGRVGSIETPINISNYIFDADLYYSLYPDLQKAFGYNENALRQHYLNFGINEGRLGSYVFDVTYYKNRYKDLKNMKNKDAYNHFVNYGIHEGRAGSQMFDVVHYLFYHDLTVAFGKNYSRALQHFVCFGINELRTSSNEFMAYVYKKENSDLAKAFGNNWKQYYKHYLIWGRHEGRIYKLFQK